MPSDLRFYKKGNMHATLERQSQAVAQAVRGLDPDVVLNTPVEDLADRLYEKFQVEPIELDLDARRSSGARDVQIEVDGWSGRTVHVEGTRVEWAIPFSGDEILLDIQPSTHNLNPPSFDVRGHEILVAVEGRAPLNPQQAKSSLEQVVSAVQQHLTWQRADIDPWNERLREALPQQIEARRQKVLQDRELDAFLEVPVVGRTNPSTSFAVDPPKRPPISVATIPSQPGFSPEPAISDTGFAQILEEIASVTRAVQRLPRTFESMPEESLRDVLLVVLNNRFGPASGETFSRRGKTDVFIPWQGDERAVFIAECKWWKGPAALRKAIDQLLGYLTWRDTCAALVVFVRSGSPTEIALKADAVIRDHARFKRMSERAGRSAYTFASPTDDRREIHIALLVVPVLP